MRDNDLTFPDEVVINKIFLIRGKKVMIDTDLAELYGVTTKRLNEQVKRNRKRFPTDFMFQLNEKEKQGLIESYSHLNRLKHSSKLPFAFTEHGAVMLASVLNSERAIEVNVQIVRIFTSMREILLANKDVIAKLEKLEKKVLAQEGDIKSIFQYLKELLTPPSQTPMRRIGFKHQVED
jgi:hypothetical protein